MWEKSPCGRSHRVVAVTTSGAGGIVPKPQRGREFTGQEVRDRADRLRQHGIAEVRREVAEASGDGVRQAWRGTRSGGIEVQIERRADASQNGRERRAGRDLGELVAAADGNEFLKPNCPSIRLVNAPFIGVSPAK